MHMGIRKKVMRVWIPVRKPPHKVPRMRHLPRVFCGLRPAHSQTLQGSESLSPPPSCKDRMRIACVFKIELYRDCKAVKNRQYVNARMVCTWQANRLPAHLPKSQLICGPGVFLILVIPLSKLFFVAACILTSFNVQRWQVFAHASRQKQVDLARALVYRDFLLLHIAIGLFFTKDRHVPEHVQHWPLSKKHVTFLCITFAGEHVQDSQVRPLAAKGIPTL